MRINQISDRVKSGEKLGGLKLNHRLLEDRSSIIQAVIKSDPIKMRIQCTHLDIQLLFFNLTGEEYTGNDAKDVMIHTLIRKCKEEVLL